MLVGERVLIKDKDWIGIVAFVGTTHFAPGEGIGVALDDPLGKNNGSVQGKKYFSCAENHGIFIRQSQITSIETGAFNGLLRASS